MYLKTETIGKDQCTSFSRKSTFR